MTLILRNHQVRGLMPLSGYIEAVEEGYRQVGLGQGAGLPRHNIWLQGDRSQAVGGGHMPPGPREALSNLRRPCCRASVLRGFKPTRPAWDVACRPISFSLTPCPGVWRR